MSKFDVQIEGTSGEEKTFFEIIEVDAENEEDANRKAGELCLISGPQGKLNKHNQGPKAVTWMITKTTRK